MHQLAGKVAAWLIWGKPTAAFLKPERLVDGNGMVQTRWRQRLLWPDRYMADEVWKSRQPTTWTMAQPGLTTPPQAHGGGLLGSVSGFCLPAGQYGRVPCLLRWWLAGTSNKPCKCFSSDCRTDTAFTLRNMKG